MPVVSQADDKGNLQAASSKKEGSSDAKPHAMHYHAPPGPVIPDKNKMEKPLSKEELKKKAEELN